MKNSSLLTQTAPTSAVALTLVTPLSLSKWEKAQGPTIANWFKSCGFTGKPGTHALIPGHDGQLSRVVASVQAPLSLWDLAALPALLPEGTYVLEGVKNAEDETKLALGWLLGAYRYNLHKKVQPAKATLCVSKKINLKTIEDKAEAINATRTLITMPAEDLGPAELAAAVVAVAKKHGAKVSQIVGDQLLKKNYPAIHAVGRGSHREPRLIDLTWGNPKHPLVTLVGKGVCFDTGGLDLKPTAAMYLMRKDMGGAAVTLGLADLIMRRKLKIRLRVLIAAVENAVDAKAFRPSDVITMRNGLTVEVGNTDAEGRLVLADMLSEACTDKPELLIDFSTLTGAARSAIGTDIAALLSTDDAFARQLTTLGQKEEDYIWQLPLHDPYNKMLDSQFADLTSSPNSPYAGAIVAGLFLKRFVTEGTKWAHFDFMAWNLTTKPGRPEGGEAMTLRAVYAFLEKKYASE